MKKRLLLMLIAVVCLSPSIVFADQEIGYVSPKKLTAFQRSPSGEIVSVPGGPLSLGSFGAPLPPSGEAPAGNKSAAADCSWQEARIVKNAQTLQNLAQGLHGTDTAGSAIR